MNGFLDRISYVLPGIGDLIQILIVATALYYALRVLARTRAIQMLVGLVLLALTYIMARLLGLFLITHIMGILFEYGAIAALIVFAPELRNALARLGQSRMIRLFSRLEEREIYEEVVEAVERLARSKIGAIIVVEREVGLDEYAETGSRQKARVTADMIVSLFAPYGPLHDGAVIIEGDQIVAAGVILPLTQFPVQDKSLGTRHRAALGLSEETDALVIVVSEETAQVSLADRGRLERNVDLDRVRETLAGAGPARGARVPAATAAAS
jgi:diadenylate cyclase